MMLMGRIQRPSWFWMVPDGPYLWKMEYLFFDDVDVRMTGRAVVVINY